MAVPVRHPLYNDHQTGYIQFPGGGTGLSLPVRDGLGERGGRDDVAGPLSDLFEEMEWPHRGYAFPFDNAGLRTTDLYPPAPGSVGERWLYFRGWVRAYENHYLSKGMMYSKEVELRFLSEMHSVLAQLDLTDIFAQHGPQLRELFR